LARSARRAKKEARRCIRNVTSLKALNLNLATSVVELKSEVSKLEAAKRLPTVDSTNSNNDASIVTSTNSNNDAAIVDSINLNNGASIVTAKNSKNEAAAMEKEIGRLRAELSDCRKKGEELGKKYQLHLVNITSPALKQQTLLQKVNDKLSKEVDNLEAEVEVQKSQLERLRFAKEQFALKRQEANVPKQPVLTQSMITCVYSSAPSDTEEKKKPHRRGNRGKGKKKNTPNQSVIDTSANSNISNANVAPANLGIEEEAAEEIVPDQVVNVAPATLNISNGNVDPIVSNIEEEQAEEQLDPIQGAIVALTTLDISEGNVIPAVSDDEEDAAAPQNRNRHRAKVMTLKTYKYITTRARSHAHYIYTPLFFFFISLCLSVSLSRNFKPATLIGYEPGLLLSSPLPPNAPGSSLPEVYINSSLPIPSLLNMGKPAPTPTSSLPPTPTSPMSGAAWSGCIPI
jgi:cell division protein FtsB